ncbi:MAG: AbrB/MazE/SpoVT family DNA-binding domain-containing protein [Actinomycetota bacterium]|nr:AbrB/MazE/SpoVT family DNA-binding domain-containing protein [Actinomycetota bacterium]
MSRITKKGQVTIPKEIRDRFDIKANDIGEFTVKEKVIIFTVKKGTILDAHKIKTDRKIDFEKIRESMKEDIAAEVTEDL